MDLKIFFPVTAKVSGAFVSIGVPPQRMAARSLQTPICGYVISFEFQKVFSCDCKPNTIWKLRVKV